MDLRPYLLVGFFAASIAHAEDTIMPGLYDLTVNTEMKMGDMSMPGRSMNEQHCLTAEDVAKGPPVPEPGDDAECEVTQYELSGGSFTMAMSCTMDGGSGQMVGSGTYTKDSYEMNNVFKMKAQGMEVEMRSKAVGKRLKAC